MLVPNRTSNTEEYRYGFQGQEKDDEVKGAGNSINYKYRMHDPRVGRFFAMDPLAHEYPHNSPYAFSENQVIAAVELEGLEKVDISSPIMETTGDVIMKVGTAIENSVKATANFLKLDMVFPGGFAIFGSGLGGDKPMEILKSSNPDRVDLSKVFPSGGGAPTRNKALSNFKKGLDLFQAGQNTGEIVNEVKSYINNNLNSKGGSEDGNLVKNDNTSTQKDSLDVCKGCNEFNYGSLKFRKPNHKNKAENDTLGTIKIAKKDIKTFNGKLHK